MQAAPQCPNTSTQENCWNISYDYFSNLFLILKQKFRPIKAPWQNDIVLKFPALSSLPLYLIFILFYFYIGYIKGERPVGSLAKFSFECNRRNWKLNLKLFK